LLKLAERKAAAQINRILEHAGIPKELYWFVSAVMQEEVIPKFINRSEAILKKAILKKDNTYKKVHKHGYGCDPQITLIGYRTNIQGRPYITPVFTTNCEVKNINYTDMRFVLESLRQQIVNSCGIVCPYGFMEKCCGRREMLKRIYEFIPEAYKKDIRAPDCGRPE
jgi:hypothetical protein